MAVFVKSSRATALTKAAHVRFFSDTFDKSATELHRRKKRPAAESRFEKVVYSFPKNGIRQKKVFSDIKFSTLGEIRSEKTAETTIPPTVSESRPPNVCEGDIIPEDMVPRKEREIGGFFFGGAMLGLGALLGTYMFSSQGSKPKTAEKGVAPVAPVSNEAAAIEPTPVASNKEEKCETESTSQQDATKRNDTARRYWSRSNPPERPFSSRDE